MDIDSLKYPYQNLSLADMEGEVWKDIKGYEGYYMASNMGRIKSLERIIFFRSRFYTRKERILKQNINTSKQTKIRKIINKQLFIVLYIDGIATGISMSRIMYATFIKPLTRKQLVSHHDEDRFNNKPENLYVTTFRDLGKRNMQTGKAKAPIANAQSTRKAHNIAVSKYDTDGKYIRSYESLVEASSQENIHPNVISRACSRKRKLTGGFIWRYGVEKQKLSSEILSQYKKPKASAFAVSQYDTQGNYIQSFESIAQASQNTGMKAASIRRVCQGINELVDGFIWLLGADKEPLSKEEIRVFQNPKAYTLAVSQYDTQGNFIQSFESIAQASRNVGVNTTSIRRVCIGKNKLAGGFIWRLGVDSSALSEIIIARHTSPPKYSFEKAVNQYDLEGNYIRTFSSITKAAQVAGIGGSTLSRPLKRKGTFTYNGYIWRYANSEEKE